jgi:hypothetical protein
VRDLKSAGQRSHGEVGDLGERYRCVEVGEEVGRARGISPRLGRVRVMGGGVPACDLQRLDDIGSQLIRLRQVGIADHFGTQTRRTLDGELDVALSLGDFKNQVLLVPQLRECGGEVVRKGLPVAAERGRRLGTLNHAQAHRAGSLCPKKPGGE